MKYPCEAYASRMWDSLSDQRKWRPLCDQVCAVEKKWKGMEELLVEVLRMPQTCIMPGGEGKNVTGVAGVKKVNCFGGGFLRKLLASLESDFK